MADPLTSDWLLISLFGGEYTIVLDGMPRVEHAGGAIEVPAGQAVLAHRGEWVRFSTPGFVGTVYIAVGVPAFSLEAVHRDA